ncbi:MAG: hypothetical protein ACLVKO_06960 [Dysgonomonas sp.]
MSQKRIDPVLIVNEFKNLKEWVKQTDPLLADFITNEYYYAKIGEEFGYKSDTVRRILVRELLGKEYYYYKKKKIMSVLPKIKEIR